MKKSGIALFILAVYVISLFSMPFAFAEDGDDSAKRLTLEERIDNEIEKLEDEIAEIKIKYKDKPLSVSDPLIEKKEKKIDSLRDSKLILFYFDVIWGILKYVVVPLIIVLILRNYLLLLIAEGIDRVIGHGTAFAQTLVKMATLGKSWIGFGLWFIVFEYIYISILNSTSNSFMPVFLNGVFNFIEETIFFMVAMTIDILGVEPDWVIVAVLTVISAALIILVLAGVFHALVRVLRGAAGARRRAKAEKAGRDMSVLTETAKAAAENIR